MCSGLITRQRLEGCHVNVLIINASPRRTGTTSALLAELRGAISPKHHVEVVRIHDLTMKPCIGCLKCRPDKRCVLPRDDAHVLAEAIKQADVLVIGSPVYWGNMPGQLKVFFDRNVPLFEYSEARPIHYVPRPQLKGKRAYLIVCGGSPWPYNLLSSQSQGTVRSLKTILKAGGIIIDAVLNVPDSYAFEQKAYRYMQQVRRLAEAISS